MVFFSRNLSSASAASNAAFESPVRILPKANIPTPIKAPTAPTPVAIVSGKPIDAATVSSTEIMGKLDSIETKLTSLNPYSPVMLKYSLAHKSIELQRIYIKSIVNELRVVNNEDLDSYFFGPLSIGYKSSGENFLEREAKEEVVSYLREVQYKYLSRKVSSSKNQNHVLTTAPYYFELIKNMHLTTDKSGII